MVKTDLLQNTEARHWTEKFTVWVGSPKSLIVHTILFIVFLSSPFFGFNFQDALLVLTTIVSLEAIYLALFIQMSINRANTAIEEVSEDVEEISEDVEDIGEEIEEIEKDLDDISEMHEDVAMDIEKMEKDIDEMQEDIEEINEEEETATPSEKDRLANIEKTLHEILTKLNKI